MPLAALTSAEISLPGRPDVLRVRERLAALADTVDLVGLTDNHAGQPRMSPLAAVALAREQGVATVVHVSCRDRNRMALQSQVVGAAALGSEGVLCLYGDAVEGVPRVKDLTATSLIGKAKEWAQPHELAVGAVVNPFAPDLGRELRLLERKVGAGIDFLQPNSQPCPESTPCTSIHSARKAKRATWQRRSAARAARPSGDRNRLADLLLRARCASAHCQRRRRRRPRTTAVSALNDS